MSLIQADLHCPSTICEGVLGSSKVSVDVCWNIQCEGINQLITKDLRGLDSEIFKSFSDQAGCRSDLNWIELDSSTS